MTANTRGPNMTTQMPSPSKAASGPELVEACIDMLLSENERLRAAHAELVGLLDDLKALLPVARIMHPQDMDALITRVHEARAALGGGG